MLRYAAAGSSGKGVETRFKMLIYRMYIPLLQWQALVSP